MLDLVFQLTQQSQDMRSSIQLYFKIKAPTRIGSFLLHAKFLLVLIIRALAWRGIGAWLGLELEQEGLELLKLFKIWPSLPKMQPDQLRQNKIRLMAFRFFEATAVPNWNWNGQSIKNST